MNSQESDPRIRYAKLQQMQALPLDAKVDASTRRIREWYQHWEGDVCVSFSGGRDSTVLLHLVRSLYPDVPAVFADTGLELPEVRSFALAQPNVQIVRPKLSFLEVVQKYGYPMISKKMAQYIREARSSRCRPESKMYRLRMEGYRDNGLPVRPLSRISKRWQFLVAGDFPRISDQCCQWLKKKPMAKIPRPYVGVMATESETRRAVYVREGCNSFDSKTPASRPLSFWLGTDIKQYIVQHGLPISDAYTVHGYERTGCAFCCFGLHMEKRPHRFDILQRTHPQLFKYVMDGPLQLRAAIVAVHGPEILEPIGGYDWL